MILDPLSAVRRKLKEISLRTKHTQHDETVQELPNSKSSTSSEHQACTSSRDTLSLTAQFLKNQNAISCPSKSNKKDLGNFNIDRILFVDSNLWRDKEYSDISIVQNNNSKLPLKKRFLTITPPTQLDDKEIITVDCNVSNNILQKYPKEIDRSGSTNKKFCETDFVNMFQNLPTPSTVNRLYRSKKSESQNKHSERFEKSTDLYTDVSSRECKAVQFHNCVRSQDPLQVLTSAAAFVEAGHLPQTEAGNLFTDRYIPISSNCCNLFDQQPSQLYCSQNAGPSNFNIEPAKQRHCTSQNSHRCEEKHTCHNYSNCSHEYNISQAHHQNHAETIRTTVAPGCSYLPVHYSSVASNYVNLPNNVGHTRILPLVPNHDPYTYPQQVDDHQRMVCLQNCTQPIKYFALDNGVNVHKVPLYVKDSVCQCQNHRHKSICPH